MKIFKFRLPLIFFFFVSACVVILTTSPLLLSVHFENRFVNIFFKKPISCDEMYGDVFCGFVSICRSRITIPSYFEFDLLM